ncbi:hypothetical protein [Oligosphaera ethanolica]|uniref:Uncharacterized protein n=1 Tax=Oligosphaera ethanolica TaxID=760260 RepID=A0AAE4AL82_9BACT|nr:hypothetical protein [Oligosphaera ethanolica]MDQ0287979.1 hypothetical protein [Oligosphaera ethanolica]
MTPEGPVDAFAGATWDRLDVLVLAADDGVIRQVIGVVVILATMAPWSSSPWSSSP